jgi:hypothetical protein
MFHMGHIKKVKCIYKEVVQESQGLHIIQRVSETFQPEQGSLKLGMCVHKHCKGQFSEWDAFILWRHKLNKQLQVWELGLFWGGEISIVPRAVLQYHELAPKKYIYIYANAGVSIWRLDDCHRWARTHLDGGKLDHAVLKVSSNFKNASRNLSLPFI